MKEYCEEHDAFYDLSDDEWLEKTCSSKSCEYCKNRPDKPSGVNNGTHR